MSKTILLNQNWIFSKDGHDETVTLPHTWNAVTILWWQITITTPASKP